MKSVGEILKTEEFKEFSDQISKLDLDRLNEGGFIRFPVKLFNSIFFGQKLTKRQLLIIHHIIRFSIGCKQAEATLKPADFQILGIHISDITKELKKLKKKNLIGWDREKGNVWITPTLLGEIPSKKQKVLGKLLTKNLVKHQPDSRYFTNQMKLEDTESKPKPVSGR